MKATQLPPGWTRMLALVRGSKQENMEVQYISESSWP